MKYDVMLEQIANCYYNLGLERARLRDLSGAAELLKKSLTFDKYQKDARNLLGLIFFECGETADALVQWVISMNLLPQDNIADHYLDEIQRKPAILRICSDNVKRYNQALDYAQNNNEDLAIMQLNQVIEDSPNYIKAHILLALLYMKREDWVKAGRSLYLVLKIDRNMTDDDVLIPQEVKQVSPWMVVGYIFVGIILALFASYLLIMPAKTKALNAENNRELISYTEKLDASNRAYAELKDSYDTLESQYAEAAQQVSQFENANASFMGQYQSLNEIRTALANGDVLQAAKLYTGLDQTKISDATMLQQLQSIKVQMEGSIYQELAEQATNAWNSGNRDQAAELYNLSLAIREEPENMYLLGRLYQSMGRTEEANTLFDKIIGAHPDSNYAERARQARGY